MHRLLELETREPAAMQLGPSRPPVMAPLAQQEPRELLTRPAQCMHRVETGAHQIAHCFVPGIRNPYRRQLARSMQPRQTGCIPPIRLDPVARSPRDQRGGNHDAFVTVHRHVTLNAIAARPRLVAEPKPDALAAEPAHQPIQRCRRVRDPAVLPNLAPRAARGHRNNDAFLVNIKPNVADTIRHDPSPMHEARHRPRRRNPRYLHTVRRVAPCSGGHVVWNGSTARSSAVPRSSASSPTRPPSSASSAPFSWS